MKTVKVRVTLDLPIDADAWAKEYGTDPWAASVRADVREHIRQSVWSHLESLGLLAEDA